MDSILNQTYENFELIIINDGSTDSTADLILSRNDKRIILLENQKTYGIVNALNKGISISKGEYIARMDSDDISVPKRLEKQIEFLSEEKNIDILGTGYKILGTDKHIYGPASKDLQKIYLLKQNTICHPTVMIRKKAIQQKKLRYDKNAPSAEDYKLWIDASINNLNIGNLQDSLLEYRYHLNRISLIKRAEQIYLTNLIKFGYANHYFSNILSNRAKPYMELISGSPIHHPNSDKYKDTEHAELTQSLITENNNSSYFAPSLFQTFITDRLQELKETFASTHKKSENQDSESLRST
jgi:glycosyltransferase involved in cell wall biosynthesis